MITSSCDILWSYKTNKKNNANYFIERYFDLRKDKKVCVSVSGDGAKKLNLKLRVLWLQHLLISSWSWNKTVSSHTRMFEVFNVKFKLLHDWSSYQTVSPTAPPPPAPLRPLQMQLVHKVITGMEQQKQNKKKRLSQKRNKQRGKKNKNTFPLFFPRVQICRP